MKETIKGMKGTSRRRSCRVWTSNLAAVIRELQQMPLIFEADWKELLLSRSFSKGLWHLEDLKSPSIGFGSSHPRTLSRGERQWPLLEPRLLRSDPGVYLYCYNLIQTSVSCLTGERSSTLLMTLQNLPFHVILSHWVYSLVSCLGICGNLSKFSEEFCLQSVSTLSCLSPISYIDATKAFLVSCCRTR